MLAEPVYNPSNAPSRKRELWDIVCMRDVSLILQRGSESKRYHRLTVPLGIRTRVGRVTDEY